MAALTELQGASRHPAAARRHRGWRQARAGHVTAPLRAGRRLQMRREEQEARLDAAGGSGELRAGRLLTVAAAAAAAPHFSRTLRTGAPHVRHAYWSSWRFSQAPIRGAAGCVSAAPGSEPRLARRAGGCVQTSPSQTSSSSSSSRWGRGKVRTEEDEGQSRSLFSSFSPLLLACVPPPPASVSSCFL